MRNPFSKHKNGVEDDDQEEVDERDKKYPEPPAYYKQFSNGRHALSPPDLSILAQKDYFILYKM